MNARSTEAGFTVVELIVVLVLIGVLAVVALPRLSATDAVRDDGWREQVLAGLRLAQASAVGHRRLVCARFSGTVLELQLATVNPASTCSVVLPGPDGSASFGGGSGTSGGGTVSVSPAPTLYFQPNGQVSQDGAGSQVTSFSISTTGVPVITVFGASGHAQ